VIQAAPKVALLFLVLGAAIWAFRQPQAPPAATSATAPRSLRDTVIAIDRAFLNDPDEFVSLIYFRSAEEEQFKPVLTNYVRAESAFRREMKRAFNVQQRTFDAAFRELCVGQPPVLTNYIGLDRASTNVMIARYPLHLVKVAGAWYWDWFGGLSRVARDERRQTLVQMARTFDDLTRRVREATATNVVEILQALPSGSP
jgi:hypothetical protein